jgi:hypothetical protein
VGQGGQLAGLVLDLGDQSAHAQHDQQEQHHRAERDGGDVDGLVAQALLGEHGWGHQGGGGEQGQAPVGEPGRLVGGDLGQRPHGGVQCGRAPDHIGQQPAGVDQATFVAADQIQHGIADVGPEQQHQRQPERPVGGGAGARAGGQPGRQGQQQHIAERVGQRDQPLGQ